MSFVASSLRLAARTGSRIAATPSRAFASAATPSSEPKVTLKEKKQIRKQLRKLVPGLQQIGTQHTSMLKPSMSLEHTSSNVTLETMMAANMHVGHCASLWNPMNLPHIFGERQGVHIINLEHTLAALRRAAQFTRSVAYHGGIILFAGARSQHQQLAVDAAHFSDQYFVTGKWVPGTLTNPQSLLAKHQLYMREVWDVAEAREFADYQQAPEEMSEGRSRYLRKLADEKAKLKEDAGNVRTFAPDLVVALNPLESRTMLAETRLRHVPTVGIVDTNCDPRCVSYAIPCNDDSIRAVSVVAGVLARAARDGMDLRRQQLTAAADLHNRNEINRAASQASNPANIPPQ
ncbi:hypothetical protein EC988_002029 [Linderina pennispora]|nr:hypothetical protein EC988_002029 [Linderina pennispora]